MTFTISKLVWLVLQPSNALLIFLLLATLLAVTRRRGGRACLFAAVGCLALVSLLPVGQWLLWPLETRLMSPAELPKDIDGAIVLGGGFDGRTAALPDRVELSGAPTG